MSSRQSAHIGELRRVSTHGRTSVYRVADVANDHVLLETVDAPGLRPGFRFRATAASVAAMALVGGTALCRGVALRYEHALAA